MRIFFLAIILSAALVPLTAEEKTLFDEKVELGGYAAPVVRGTSIDGTFGIFGGFQGAVLINRTFSAGVGGYMLISDIEAEKSGEALLLMLGYGGIELGVVIASDSVVHATAGVLTGMGRVGYHERGMHDWHAMDHRMTETSGFYVVEPAADVELNIFPFLRLAAGGGYRFVLGLVDDETGLTNQDLSGPVFEIMVKVGVFSGDIRRGHMMESRE